MNEEDDLLVDLGENYEYIRKIITNTIEIKKIDYSEKVAKLLGLSLTYLLIALLMIGAFVILFIMGIILLAKMLGSTLLAMSIASGFLLLSAVIIWQLKNMIFVKPLLKTIYKNIL